MIPIEDGDIEHFKTPLDFDRYTERLEILVAMPRIKRNGINNGIKL